jgi:TRAP-type mannitol/chloroaromatic compound transport system permease small subunit
MKEAGGAGDAHATDPVGVALEIGARAAAVFGGLVLTFAMLVTVVSIIGRALLQVGNFVPGLGWLGPVPGDYEIVEMGAAVAVAAFLPICQLRGGHVIVDLLFSDADPRALASFALLGNLLFAIVGAVIAWRLYLGAMSKFQYNESSMILGIGIGWGYLGLTVFFALAVLCAAYLVVRDLQAILRARRA